MGQRRTTEVVIVGGGAAGLVAALVASLEAKQRGLPLRVTVVERMAECGRKLRATGNGRGNLGARGLSPGHYVTTGSAELLASIIARCDQEAVLELFQAIGLPLAQEDNRLYPLSLQAAQVREALVLACVAQGVDIQNETELIAVHSRTSDYQLTLQREEAEQTLTADYVLLALGGSTQPALGANGSWQDWLTRAGVQISELRPALQALEVIKPYRSLRGQRQVAEALLWQRSRAHDYLPIAGDRGEVQFTATGLSGVVIMQLSLFAQARPVQGGTVLRVRDDQSRVNPATLKGSLTPLELRTLYGKSATSAEYLITLDLFPDWSSEDLARELKRRTRETPWLQGEQLLIGLLPDKLAHVLMLMLEKLAPQSSQKLDALIQLMKQMPFPLAAEQNSPNAQVSLGGIQLSELREHSYELKAFPRMYACGEMLDIAGMCGGYNLAFAFASARAAAREIIASLDGV